jgi:hypothetical protein
VGDKGGAGAWRRQSYFPFLKLNKPGKKYNFCSAKVGENSYVPSHKGPIPLRSEQWELKILQTFWENGKLAFC